jgi:acetyl-CoA synthase
MSTLVTPAITYYTHRLSNRAIEVRGLNVSVPEIPIPVAFSTAFEGERVRDKDTYLDCGGGWTKMVEWVTSRHMNEVEDGKVEVIGPEITDVPTGSVLPLAIVIEVAGRDMKEDYEPVLERQVHRIVNYIQGVMYCGQRDIAWLRVSQQAVEKGFRLSHIGLALHASFHHDFGRIFDRLQVKIYTEANKVSEAAGRAREGYHRRDARIDSMTDERTETYYSCTICQSIAPSHVCIISPERAGQCGYNWLDGKVSYGLNPIGPNQPVPKGEKIDTKLGQWNGINTFVFKTSGGKIDRYNLYSVVNSPMTTSGICECIAAVLPMCNGIMTVNREYSGETPSGMRFNTMVDIISGGLSTPGFGGHGKYNTTQRKYLAGDGGLLRMVWMPKNLKKEIGGRLRVRAVELGMPDLPDKIADESIGTSEKVILPFLQEKGHPALTMPPLLG